jgi:iron-sulfur cluster repair protein YtfE (RIC family)
LIRIKVNAGCSTQNDDIIARLPEVTLSISDSLIHDHSVCDDLFAKTEASVAESQWPQAEAGFAKFREAMEQHFIIEEHTYFPAFEAKTGMSSGPTEVMRSEHDQMRELIEQLSGALQAHDADSYLGSSDTLCILMRQHNLKEENILYPMFDEMLEARDTLGHDTLAAPHRTA